MIFAKNRLLEHVAHNFPEKLLFSNWLNLSLCTIRLGTFQSQSRVRLFSMLIHRILWVCNHRGRGRVDVGPAKRLGVVRGSGVELLRVPIWGAILAKGLKGVNLGIRMDLFSSCLK